MAKLGVQGADHLPQFAERQAYYWLAFGLMVLVVLGYYLVDYISFRVALYEYLTR